MARFENVGREVDDYCKRTGEGSSTWDLCRSCGMEFEGYPCPDLEPYKPGEPRGTHITECDSGWMYDDDEYHCDICGTRLTVEEDY